MLNLKTTIKILMAVALVLGVSLAVVGSDRDMNLSQQVEKVSVAAEAPVEAIPDHVETYVPLAGEQLTAASADEFSADHVEHFVPLAGTLRASVPYHDMESEELARSQEAVTGTGVVQNRAQAHSGVITPATGPRKFAPFNPKSVYASADFEDATFPPTGWDTLNFNPGYGFFRGTYSGGGTYSALVTWDQTAPVTQQNEWLVTPAMDIESANSSLRVEFEMLQGYDYPHDFKIYITTDAVIDHSTTWTQIWTSAGTGYPEFEWYEVSVSLSAYAGEEDDVHLGFQYYGLDADLFGLDNIAVTDDVPPTGRCCVYTDPEDPDCSDGVTQAACAALGGTWAEGLNCTDDPCPIITGPENDNCGDIAGTDADLGTLTPGVMATYCGDNTGATKECYASVYDYDEVWVGFTVPAGMVMNIELSYCGTSPAFENGYTYLSKECPCGADETNDYVTPTSFNGTDCGDGNFTLFYDGLTEGDYFYPIMTNDPTYYCTGPYCLNVTGTEVVQWGACCHGDPTMCSDVADEAACDALGGSFYVGEQCATFTCPEVGEGDVCENPWFITIPADLPYVDNNTTCGHGNEYWEETCYYTQYGYGYGEDMDVVYEVTVTETSQLDFFMDPQGTAWTYVEMRTECPDDDPDGSSCLFYFRNTSSTPYANPTNPVTVAAGTYYIVIDSWIAKDGKPDLCIDNYTLSIQDHGNIQGRCCFGSTSAPSCEVTNQVTCEAKPDFLSWDQGLDCTTPCPILQVGDNCGVPILVKIPEDMIEGTGAQYLDTNYTCGRGNYYNMTCLGSYDGGEEIIYELDVTGPIALNFTLNPMGTTWTGIAVADACPPGSTCLAYHNNSGSSIHGISNLELTTGTYYVMIDTYPSPDCIPEFELIIEEFVVVEGDNCDLPISVKIPEDMTMGAGGDRYIDDNYTCLRINDYANTGLGYYDGGEDIIYELDVSGPITLDFTLDPHGTTYTGIGIFETCPPGATAFAMSTNSGSTVHGMKVTLNTGLYYVMIDTWPSPACIPNFTLTIAPPCEVECPAGAVAETEPCGSDVNGGCNMVTPAFEPMECGKTVCGTIWADKTLSTRDTDWFLFHLDGWYEVSWTAQAEIGIVSGFLESNDPGSGDCGDLTGYIAPYVQLDKCVEGTVTTVLGPGDHMAFLAPYPYVDAPCDNVYYATLECTPVDGPEITVDPAGIDFGWIVYGDYATGNTPLTISNTGPGGEALDFDIQVLYRSGKEINGAYIYTTVTEFIPGSTASIDFFLQNASSDYEWLDGATIAFPTGVTVNSATNFVCTTSSSRYLQYSGAPGGTATWIDHNGGYGNLYGSDLAKSTVNLTFDGGLVTPITINYTISGDNYGSPPHDVAGSFTMDPDIDPSYWLSVDIAAGSIPAGGAPIEVTVTYKDLGLDPGVYEAVLKINHNSKGNYGAPVYVPVVLEVRPPYIWEPSPMVVFYKNAIVPMTGALHFGDAAMGGDVTGVTVTSFDVEGTSVAFTPLPLVVDYGYLTGNIAGFEFPVRDFVLAVEASEGAIYEAVGAEFTVNYLDGATPGSFNGKITIFGHIAGDLNKDAVVDISDLVYFVNWAFKNGPAPEIMVAADVNGSGGDADIADLVYLVNFMFKNGPTPVQP